MFKVLEFARRPQAPIIAAFARWLNRECPWLLSQLGRLRTDKITSFRNRENHANIHGIKANDAEVMSSICREVINLLQPR